MKGRRERRAAHDPLVGALLVGYAPVSDSLCDHIKVLGLGRDTDAMALWCLGLAWVTRHETDGKIPRKAIDTIMVSMPFQTRKRYIKALVRVGLWEDIGPDLYTYHDFLDWQRSAKELRDIRSSKRRAGYLGGKRSGEARREAAASRLLERTGTHVSSPLFTSLHSSSSAVENSPPGAAPPVTGPEGVAHATGSDSESDKPVADLARPPGLAGLADTLSRNGPQDASPPPSRADHLRRYRDYLDREGLSP
jgi:hypothetical protein